MPAPRRIRRHKLPILHAPLDVERVPRLVQRPAAAAQDHRAARDARQRRLDLGRVVRLVIRRRDARARERLVRIQSLHRRGK